MYKNDVAIKLVIDVVIIILNYILLLHLSLNTLILVYFISLFNITKQFITILKLLTNYHNNTFITTSTQLGIRIK